MAELVRMRLALEVHFIPFIPLLTKKTEMMPNLKDSCLLVAGIFAKAVVA